MAFRRVLNGVDNINDVDLDQYADAFNGVGGKAQPMDLIQLDQDRYYIVLKNLNANSKCQQMYKSDGTLLFQVDGNGVKASPDGIASAAALPPAASPTLTGTINLSGRVLRRRSSTVAAAGTVTLPSDGDVIPVSGTATITTINPIALVNLTGQAVVTLEFQSASCKVAKGATLRLNGDFMSGAPGATLTLECDGTNWNEIGRAGAFAQSARAPSAGQSVVDNAALTVMTLGTATYDPFTMKSGNTMVVPTAGLWRVHGNAIFAANGTGNRIVQVFKNGSVYAEIGATANTSGAFPFGQSFAIEDRFAANDILDVRVAINGAGANLAMLTRGYLGLTFVAN